MANAAIAMPSTSCQFWSPSETTAISKTMTAVPHATLSNRFRRSDSIAMTTAMPTANPTAVAPEARSIAAIIARINGALIEAQTFSSRRRVGRTAGSGSAGVSR